MRSHESSSICFSCQKFTSIASVHTTGSSFATGLLSRCQSNPSMEQQSLVKKVLKDRRSDCLQIVGYSDLPTREIKESSSQGIYLLLHEEPYLRLLPVMRHWDR
jgi:hypothetical protein